MSTEDIPMTNGGNSATRLQFNDPTCLMWAVLALARLDEMIPSDFEALELFEQNAPWAHRLRNVLNDAITAFCDDKMDAIWPNVYSERAEQIVRSLKHATWEYYHWHQTPNPDDERESSYLLEIFEAYHLHVRSQSPTAGEPSEMMILSKMKTVLGELLSDIFDAYNDAVYNEEHNRDGVPFVQEEGLEKLAAAVEQFVRDQTDLRSAANYDFPNSITDESFARLIRASLRDNIRQQFGEALFDLCGAKYARDQQNDAESQALAAEQRDEFAAMVSCLVVPFFFYDSPLLEAYFIPDIDPGDSAFEQDEENDFEQDQDSHWYAGQYELHETQDVLWGPEHAPLDEVSQSVTAPDDPSCSVCGDETTEMRKLTVCGHELCATCLDTQLNIRHECRYKCALCRAKFFPGI
ncbi:hypothetical protein BDW02DRAFT_575414 [Decorospora gaudefroyi]|uniref:RING-type domain-containing protein n=1 Tax=Decorospora gaudefroyi TaxID=184978 RepID=A0A6A5KSU5_9PLEO|nr:hypothetical protein BDW02DRAFT_575414 [Decorospora gaudefroyi]